MQGEEGPGEQRAGEGMRQVRQPAAARQRGSQEGTVKARKRRKRFDARDSDSEEEDPGEEGDEDYTGGCQGAGRRRLEPVLSRD